MNLSEQEKKEVIKKAMQNKEPVFFNALEIERIYINILSSKESELTQLKLVEFDCYIDGLINKLLKPPKTPEKEKQVNILESMKGFVFDCIQVNNINKMQIKVIERLRLKNSIQELEIEKLKKVINYE